MVESQAKQAIGGTLSEAWVLEKRKAVSTRERNRGFGGSGGARSMLQHQPEFKEEELGRVSCLVCGAQGHDAED